MMMLMLDLGGKKVTIFGAGKVGARKLRFLNDSRALVTVVGKDMDPKISNMKWVKVIEAEVSIETAGEYLDGAFLTVVATNDRDINRGISAYAKEKGILVNVVDDPELCDVFFPSMVRNGSMMIGIGTLGSSPSMCRYMREKFETELGPEYGLMTELQENMRAFLRTKGTKFNDKKVLLRRLLDSKEVWGLLKGGRTIEARELAKELMRI